MPHGRWLAHSAGPKPPYPSGESFSGRYSPDPYERNEGWNEVVDIVISNGISEKKLLLTWELFAAIPSWLLPGLLCLGLSTVSTNWILC